MQKGDRKAAFFDIDGTLFRSSLLVELVEYLIEHQVFPPETREKYERAYRAWQNREGTYYDYIDGVVEAFRSHIKGIHYGVLAEAGKEIVRVQQKRIYQYTRDLIKQLKAEGYYLVTISQSPKTILDEFCAEYGFDKVYGRIYEIGPQDRFTGVVEDESIIANKANIIRRVSEKEGIDLSQSVGVGDTEGDIPFLELVGKPICFNPSKVLYEHAKRLGWSVVVERKDVLYTLQ